MVGFSENRHLPQQATETGNENGGEQREILTRRIEQAIVDWLDRHVKEREPNEQDLVHLTEYLTQEESETLLSLANNFTDRALYPDRPSVRFKNAAERKMPFVCLLGWRQDQSSSIHDHGSQTVAAYTILKGSITEEQFIAPENLGLNAESPVTVQKRQLTQNQTSSGSNGFIHRVSNTESVLGLSLHAYYPPIKTYKKYALTQKGGIKVTEEIHK